MHRESIEIMKEFLAILDHDKEFNVLDVGSAVVPGSKGTYRQLMPEKWNYTGLDMVKRDNVDVVAESPYKYPFADNHFDIVISGQTLEHVAYIWLWIKEIYRVAKKGGKVYIIAPSRGKRHCRPDYWRTQPDGMRALLEYAGFKDIKADIDLRSIWQDCWGTAIK